MSILDIMINIRWEEIPPMSYARASPAVAASNGKIYAIGDDTYNKNKKKTTVL